MTRATHAHGRHVETAAGLHQILTPSILTRIASLFLHLSNGAKKKNTTQGKKKGPGDFASRGALFTKFSRRIGLG